MNEKASVGSPFFGAFPSHQSDEGNQCTEIFLIHKFFYITPANSGKVLKVIHINGNICCEDFSIRLSLTFLQM